MTQNPTVDLTVLSPEREVTVVEEEHHQLVLAGYAPAPGEPPRRVVAELVFAPIANGGHAGRHGIEVRLDGRRVGELTFRMAQRYIPLLQPLVARGQRVGCRALVKHGRRGLVEVELRLPEERHTPVPVPLPDDRSGRRRAPGSPRSGTGRMVGIGAGVVGLLLLVGALNRPAEPAPVATPAAPVVTAAPAATSAPLPSATPEASIPAVPTPSTRAVAPPTRQQSVPRAEPEPEPAAKAAPKPAPDPEPEAKPSGGAAYYPNCAAAKAAGAAPMSAGEPGYSTKLDRDKDGIACE